MRIVLLSARRGSQILPRSPDPGEDLEIALGALDSLQATGCQVGVISHVDGIAERIGAVVEVRPEGSGQSRVLARSI